MIEFANGCRFDFCAASGALGFDGRGWWWEFPLRWAGLLDPSAFVVIAKTVTDRPRAGNLSMLHPWTCVRPLGGLTTTNAVGLTNPGIGRWLARDYLRGRRMGYALAASVKPETPDEAGRMARLLRAHEFPFVEVNVSCPNVDHVPDDVPEILRHLRECGHPVILKLSVDQVQSAFVDATGPHVDAYHAINTIPWDRAFPGRASPIRRYRHGQAGGVSGPPIHPHALAAVRRLRSLTSRPIVGGGGVFSSKEAENFRDAGADAVSIGTCFLYRPWCPNRIVRELSTKGGSP